MEKQQGENPFLIKGYQDASHFCDREEEMQRLLANANDGADTTVISPRRMKGVRIWFTYKLYNEQNELINEAETELAFVGLNNWKPCAPPDFLIKAIEARQK